MNKYTIINTITERKEVEANSIEELKLKYPNAQIEEIKEDKENLQDFFESFLKAKEKLDIKIAENKELEHKVFEKESTLFEEIKKYIITDIIPMIKQSYHKEQLIFKLRNRNAILHKSSSGRSWDLCYIKEGVDVSNKNDYYGSKLDIGSILLNEDLTQRSDHYYDGNRIDRDLVRYWDEAKLSIEQAVLGKLKEDLETKEKERFSKINSG